MKNIFVYTVLLLLFYTSNSFAKNKDVACGKVLQEGKIIKELPNQYSYSYIYDDDGAVFNKYLEDYASSYYHGFLVVHKNIVYKILINSSGYMRNSPGGFDNGEVDELSMECFVIPQLKEKENE